MPDDYDSTRDAQQVAQRGFPGRGVPRGGFPRRGVPGRGFPGRGFPRGRFPRRFPIRRPFPGPIIFPFFPGFPPQRCFYIDRFGRCCDQFGRCYYRGPGPYPFASLTEQDGWYGVPGGWDMMADMDDGYDEAGDMVAYIDDDFD